MNPEFETPNGKKIEFLSKGFGIRVKFAGGGELPHVLSGSYTTYQAAYDSVRMYLADMEKKVKYKPEINKEDLIKPRKKVANAN